MNKTSKIIAAFALGAAAGSVLGMLLVPDKDRKNCKKEKETQSGSKHGEAGARQA